MKDEPVFEYHSDDSVISLSLPDSTRKSIKINPGWSFGTGNHETTRLCIRMLEWIFAGQNIKKLLDIGCGSGVLSLCAAVLGAEKVVGIDIDSSIIEEAWGNARSNGLSDNISFSTKKLSDFDQKFEVIIANILLETIEGLLPMILGKIEDNGFFIVSGIRSEEKQKALDLFLRFGFTLKDQTSEKDWTALTLRYK